MTLSYPEKRVSEHNESVGAVDSHSLPPMAGIDSLKAMINDDQQIFIRYAPQQPTHIGTVRGLAAIQVLLMNIPRNEWLGLLVGLDHIQAVVIRHDVLINIHLSDGYIGLVAGSAYVTGFTPCNAHDTYDTWLPASLSIALEAAIAHGQRKERAARDFPEDHTYYDLALRGEKEGAV